MPGRQSSEPEGEDFDSWYPVSVGEGQQDQLRSGQEHWS